jgi:xylulokinase
MYLMGIEIGTREYRAGIYDERGNLVAYANKPVKISYFVDQKHPLWSFWEPDEVWESVVSVIRRALEQISDVTQVRGLAVTGVGLDGLPVDRNGAPLYPIISWHCMRAEQQARILSDEVGKMKIFQTTGNQVMANQTIYRFMWIKEQYPEIYENTYKWLMIEDYVNMKLCGAFVTDKSLACTTSMFDIGKQRWAKDLLSRVGINTEKLPEVADSGEKIGMVTGQAAKETGLSGTTCVISGGHDYMCSALATGSYDRGSILDILGSWEMVIAGTDKPILSDDIYNSGFMEFNQVAREHFAIVGEVVSAGMLDWFKAMLFTSLDSAEDDMIWREAYDLASKNEPIGKGVFFLPHCYGAGAPNPDSMSSGAFIGLHDMVELTDLISAMVEGLNFQFRNMLDAFSKALKTEVSTITCAGEETMNSYLMQNKADVTGRCIEVPSIGSEATFGAAILAGIGCGIFGKYEDAIKTAPGAVYEPRAEHMAKYDEGFEIYKRIYPAMKELNNDIFNAFRLKELSV